MTMLRNYWLRNKDTVISVLILIPSVLAVGIFIYGFIGNTIYISMTDWGQKASMAENPVINFIGLQNYQQLFSNIIHMRFRQDLVNAFFYTVILLGGTIIIGLFLAILLDRKIEGETFFKTIFLYPMALSFIVSGTIWRWMFSPQGGLNVVPTWFGGKRIEFLWMSSRKSILEFNWQRVIQIAALIAALVLIVMFIMALKERIRNNSKITGLGIGAAVLLIYALIIHPFLPPILPYEEKHGYNLATLGISIAGIWQYAGYTMALYLAGLRSLPEAIRESAKIDGANEFTYYWKIAIPNMKPITLSAFIILTHISLKMFDLIYAMSGADNANTGHPSLNMYLTTFRANNISKGAAIAVVLFILAAFFIIPYMIHTYKERKEQ